MAKIEYYSDLDLKNNQIKNVVIEKVDTLPTTGLAVGRMVSKDGKIYVCQNTTYNAETTWKELAQGGDVSGITTRVGTIESKIGIDSTGANLSSLDGTILGDIADLAEDLGAASTGGSEATGLHATVEAIDDDLGSKTDAKDAAGSAFARIAQNAYDLTLKAPLASPALTGTPTAPTPATTSNDTTIATTAFVKAAFAANDAMVFKGTVGSGTPGSLPASGYSAGDTYKVAVAGTYAGVACEAGDMIVCVKDYASGASNADWSVIQTNIDGAVTGPASSTASHIATFNGTSGKIIQDSGYTIETSVPSGAVFTDTTYGAKTSGGLVLDGNNDFALETLSGMSASSYGNSDNVTGSYGGTFKVPYITTDATGRITAIADKTITLPASDNTDTQVTQTAATDDAEYSVLLRGATGTDTGTGTAKFAATTNKAVTVNPSTGAMTVPGGIVGNVSGNAGTATSLLNSRNISITGGVTAAGTAFNGTADIALNVTSLDATKLSGEAPIASSPFVVNKQAITVSTAGTPVEVTHGCAGGVCTATLWDSDGYVVMAEIQIGTGVNDGKLIVTCSATGTFTLGWSGIRSAPQA